MKETARILRLGLPLIVLLSVLGTLSSAATQQTVFWKKDYIHDDSGAIIATAVPGGPAPSDLLATASSTTQVNLTWSPAAGASSYRIERRFGGGAFAAIGVTSTASYNDATASANVTYVYRVCAELAGSCVSAYSNIDLATTILFTDDPLTAGVTVVKAQHFNELRQAVNVVRATAGLSASAWTDSSLTGVAAKTIHVEEMRSSLGAALAALGLPVGSYTDPTLVAGMTLVKKAHVDELRQRVK